MEAPPPALPPRIVDPLKPIGTVKAVVVEEPRRPVSAPPSVGVHGEVLKSSAEPEVLQKEGADVTTKAAVQNEVPKPGEEPHAEEKEKVDVTTKAA